MRSEGMSAADWRAWESARTLADLGELTARWLEGDLASRPGYLPGAGPDDETRPLVGVLASCNRAGYVTHGSQPGVVGVGEDSTRWAQRAGVQGFASPEVADRIYDVAGQAGLTVILHAPAALPRFRTRYGQVVPVTVHEARPCTWFGAHLSRRHLRDAWTGYGICHPHAVEALCAAWQVTVIDPDWGHNDRLWTVLRAALAADTGRPAPGVTVPAPPSMSARLDAARVFDVTLPPAPGAGPAVTGPAAALDRLGAVWSADFGGYASGQLDASQVRCVLCQLAPCDCPPFGTPAYHVLVDRVHGRTGGDGA
jgi:hypothetical protein